MGDLVIDQEPPMWDMTPNGWDETFVDAGGGVIVRRRLTFDWTPADGEDGPPYAVKVAAEYDDENGRYEIADIHVERIAGGPAISSNHLRVVPLARWLASLKDSVVLWWAHPDINGWPDNLLPRGKLDTDALVKVGTVWLVHHVVGGNATQELANHFAVSNSLAYRWARQIRDEQIMAPLEIDPSAGYPPPYAVE